jgi:elongation factor P--(R)-beta-lysine ligase
VTVYRLDRRRISLLKQRSQVLWSIRSFFRADGFTEVQPPTLVQSPGMEPHLDAFKVTSDQACHFLHTSPEYALKKLLGAGMKKIYALGPCFRDEPSSSTHSPEFTMLEWYIVGANLFELMDHTETLVRSTWEDLGCPSISAPTGPLNLADTFDRLEVRVAFERYAKLDPWAHKSAESLALAAREQGHRVSALKGDWDAIFFEIFLNVVEPNLGREHPTFLWGWPASQAALSRLDPADMSRALRFELYAGGQELANAFDELTDAKEQRRRFEEEQALRKRQGRAVYPIDEALLTAIESMQQTAGIALGVDRLVMLLLGVEDIREVQAW